MGYASEVLDVLGEALTSEDPTVRNRLVAVEVLPPAETGFELAITAYVALRQRQYGRAYDLLSRAIELESDAWMYYDLRSVAGLESGSADLCIEDAVRVEDELDVKTARSLHVRAFLTRLDFPGRANELWLQCLDKGGEQHQVLHNFGELLLRANHFDEAAAILTRAVLAKPSSWRSYLLLSRCAELQGRHAQAEATLLDGLSSLPDGQPDGNFQPRIDLEEERIALHLAWALRLVRSGSLEEARGKLDGIATSIAELEASGGPELLTAECERRALEITIELLEGRLDDVEGMRLLWEQNRAYAHAKVARGKELAPSTLITACLGFQLQRQGVEDFAEAEVLLLTTLRDRALRDQVEAVLKELRLVDSTDPEL